MTSTRATTILNQSGDTTIVWTEDRDDEMVEIIRKKMAEGITFFVIEPRFFGLLPAKKTPVVDPGAAGPLRFRTDHFLGGDAVDHPAHYTAHPAGVECIAVVEHMNFCRGNAIKYIWRAGLKGDAVEDLKKARWYLDREIARLSGDTVKTP